MIPDKVYLDIIDEDSGYMIAPSFENNGGEEYIRKDALIEWANKQKEEAEFRYYRGDMNLVREVAFDDLIDKLNSL